MIGIGLYDEPVNAQAVGYRGLYRGCRLPDPAGDDRVPARRISWYLAQAENGAGIAYDDREKVIALFFALKRAGFGGEAIAYSDEGPIADPAFMPIGYDVCGDTLYYSPLGDGYLARYGRYPAFCADMSIEEFSRYQRGLNEAMLFSARDTAAEFAAYCGRIAGKDPAAIEPLAHWRPVAIYRYREECGLQEENG